MALNKISTEIIEIKLEGADKAERELEGLQKDLDGVEKSTRGVDKATEGAGAGFSKLQAGITTAGAALAGFQAAAAAAAAAMQAIKAPVNLAMDFERQFAQVKTLNSEIGEDLKNQLLNLAAEVPQTAGDLTAAAYQAISAGIDPGQVTQFLQAASQTAIAAGGTLTEAVEILTAGVNAFGKQGETAGSISNKLFATVKRGVTTIPELNAVFGRASAAASSYGVSVDEILGAIAQLTKQGLPTSEAVTRVNAVLKELSNESGTAAKALKNQGVQLGVTALQSKGLVGLLEEVNKATGGQADAVARLSGRQEAVQGLLKLTGDNMAAYGQIVREITTDTQAASDATETMRQTTDGAQRLFEAAKEGALRDLGNEVLPAVRDLFISMTEEINKSGDSIKAIGAVFRGAIQAVELFIKSLKPIGAILAATFSVKYAPAFISQLGTMSRALVGFGAASGAAGASAGGVFGRMFGGAALRGIGAMFGGPIGIAVTSILAGMITTAIADSVDEGAKLVREQQRAESAQDLADFLKRHGIQQNAIEERIKGAARLEAADQLRVKSAREADAGNDELAQGITALTQKIDENKTGSVALSDLYLQNKEAAEALILTLDKKSSSYGQVIAEQENAIRSAKNLEEQNAAIESGTAKLNAELKKAEETYDQNRSTLEDFRNALDQSNAAIEATRRKIQHLEEYSGLNQTVNGTASLEKQKAALEEHTKAAEEAAKNIQLFSLEVANNERALSEAEAAIENNNTNLAINKQQIAEATEQHKANEAIIEKTVTALDREIEALRTRAQEQKEVAGGNLDFIASIEKVLQIEIKAAKQRDKDAEKQRQQWRKMYEDRIKGLQKVAQAERQDELKRKQGQVKELEESTKRSQQLVENRKEIALAELEAESQIGSADKVRRRLEIESKARQESHDLQISLIEKTRVQERALAFARADEMRQRVEESNKGEEVKEAELDRISAIEARDLEAAKNRAAARILAANVAFEHEQKMVSVTAPAQIAAGEDQDAARAKEKADFLRSIGEQQYADRMTQFEANRELERLEMEAELTRLNASEAEKQGARERFSDQTVKLKQKENEAIKRLDDQQRKSSLAMANEGLENLKIAAEAAGASDSFVGKIEAAQIIAKGIYHAFQGASDQAAAISAFATGNVAQGALHQTAAIAHFAQAAAAPMMASRAASGSGGGGAAGAAGGGAVSASGPRQTATQARPEPAERQASIQFGDIVLSDVPALLSRNGQRQLGQQIAGDIARELNRQRALPGGARI